MMDACVGEDVQVLQHVTWCPLQIDGIHLQVEEELLFRPVQNQYTSLFLLKLMVAVTASVFSVRAGAEVCHSATIAPGLSPSLITNERFPQPSCKLIGCESNQVHKHANKSFCLNTVKAGGHLS